MNGRKMPPALKEFAGALLVNQIIGARALLGTSTDQQQREQLLELDVQQLTQISQALAAALSLENNIRAPEELRRAIEAQEATRAPKTGFFSS